MPKGNLSPDEKSAQIRLKSIWDSWRKQGAGRTQVLVSEQLGIGQSSFADYLNGRNPINLDFLLKFCSLVRHDPREIYPEMFELIDLESIRYSSDKEMLDLLAQLEKLSDEQLKLVRDLSENLVKANQ